MSYDYSLFKAPGPGPMSSWPPDAPAPLGTIEDVKQKLGALFPGTEWRRWEKSWFGRAPDVGAPEFQLTPDDDASCRFVTVRHVTRETVLDLCHALDVIAVDAQRMEVLRP